MPLELSLCIYRGLQARKLNWMREIENIKNIEMKPYQIVLRRKYKHVGKNELILKFKRSPSVSKVNCPTQDRANPDKNSNQYRGFKYYNYVHVVGYFIWFLESLG